MFFLIASHFVTRDRINGKSRYVEASFSVIYVTEILFFLFLVTFCDGLDKNR